MGRVTKQDRIEMLKEFVKANEPYVYPMTDDRIDYLDRIGFFITPASTHFHGAYEGGLFDHSLAVAKHLVALTKNNELRWGEFRSPVVVGLFHDLCKIDQYNSEVSEDGNVIYKYNDKSLLKGHGDKSVMILSEQMQLTVEEILCIRYHMGAFTDKDEWGDYTRAVQAYPNVLWTHHADMLASHVDII